MVFNVLYVSVSRYMSICQAIYDLSFPGYALRARQSVSTIALWGGLQFFGGLSVALWSNCLAFVLMYVVGMRYSIDILRNFWYFSGFSMLPAVGGAVAIVVLYLQLDDVSGLILAECYYWVRIASITFNFIAFCYIIAQTRRSMAGNRNPSPQELAVAVLALRMVYYPLVQAVTRLGAAFYEGAYGFAPYDGDGSDLPRFIAGLAFVLLTPAAGIGYLAIFLRMQPLASKHLYSLLCQCRLYRLKENELPMRLRGSVSNARDQSSSVNPSTDQATVTSFNFERAHSAGEAGWRMRGSELMVDEDELGYMRATTLNSASSAMMQQMDDEDLLEAIKQSSRAAVRMNDIASVSTGGGGGGGGGADSMTVSTAPAYRKTTSSQGTAGPEVTANAMHGAESRARQV